MSIVALAAMASAARADEPAPAEPAETKSDKGEVEKVVVTAERRNVSLQKSAISASVLTGTDLERKNINTIDGLQFTTPSLTIQNTGTNALVNLRGIGKAFGGIQDPSGVLIYRDGVSASPGGFVADEAYYDIASVEVLRGPQGTLAGENSTGGALFVRSREPSLDGVEGYAQAQYGTYNDVLLRGAVNVPLGDTVAVRIAGNAEHRDSFYDVSGPWTGNAGDRRDYEGRVSLLWQPTDDLEVLLKNDIMYINHGGSPAAPAALGTSHLFDLESDAHLSGMEQGVRSVLQVSYDLGNGMTLRSIAGAQWYRTSYSLDLDGTAAVPPGGTGPRVYQVDGGTDRTISEEVNLLSPDDGPFKWVLGAVYQNELVKLPRFVQSAAPGGTADTGLATAISYKTPKENWGVFGQGTYALDDTFELLAGARYSESQMTMTDRLLLLNNGTPIVDHPINDQEQSDSRLTWKVGLNVHLDDANFLYGFVATGHKSGGINPLAALAAPPGTEAPEFLPEQVTDYELGWKGSFFENHLRTQINGFYNVYKNFQVGVFDTGSGLTQLRNVPGESVTRGIEAQAQGVFGNLAFDATLAYLDTSLGTFSALDSRFPLLGNQTLTDQDLPNAPQWTASAGVQYTFELGDGATLTPRLDYGFVGARWATVFEVAPIDFLAANNLFNAQLTYDTGNNWEVALFATNLFDEQYISALALADLAQAGPPRQVGVRVAKSF